MMAEAAIDLHPNYFCHECSVQCSIDIPQNSENLTCPRCHSEFVEEITQELSEINTTPFNDSRTQDYLNLFLSALNLPPSLYHRNSSYDSSDDDNDGTPRNNQFRLNMLDASNSDHHPLEFLETVFSSMENNDPNWLSNILNANIDDYVWGENGLDNIVTRLLYQIDGPSPPPAAKEDIENLENILINDEFLIKESQCSICMETFILDDKIKKLPCLHYFHEDCILPWLKLHGTCPICRQILNPNRTDDNATTTGHESHATAATENIASITTTSVAATITDSTFVADTTTAAVATANLQPNISSSRNNRQMMVNNESIDHESSVDSRVDNQYYNFKSDDDDDNDDDNGVDHGYRRDEYYNRFETLLRYDDDDDDDFKDIIKSDEKYDAEKKNDLDDDYDDDRVYKRKV